MSTPAGKQHTFDIERVRADFPILGNKTSRDKRLAYLDSAASTQKPSQVIEAISSFYRESNANVHRGVYELSETSTELYDQARATVARLINAPDRRECVFVRNTTEAINLVASSWGRTNLKSGDTILLTMLEHHSNIVPWQLIAEQTGAQLRYVDIDDEGRLRMDQLSEILQQENVRMVAVTHVSNTLGTITPLAEITRLAHDAGALVLADAAQSVPHMQVDVQQLGVDFMAFSGHKMVGPMGIGVLYGRRDLLEAMPPYMGGGSMIRTVELDHSTWADVPEKFEAGTPSVADAVGLAAAADYLSELGFDEIRNHEIQLTNYALGQLREIPGMKLFGPEGDDRAGVISFLLDGAHPHDIASILDGEGVAVRAGHHCAQPLMGRLDVTATARASVYLYNTEEDVDQLVSAVETVNSIFRRGAK
ncbi:MAG: cysteine desulfurase [Thermomicrobiaceae bacterium]